MRSTTNSIMVIFLIFAFSGVASSTFFTEDIQPQGLDKIVPNVVAAQTQQLGITYTVAAAAQQYASCGITFDQSSAVVVIDPSLPSQPGQWQTESSPKVTYADAEVGAKYALLMIDGGQGPGPNNAVPAANFTAAYLHWSADSFSRGTKR